jgi:bacterioferritin
MAATTRKVEHRCEPGTTEREIVDLLARAYWMEIETAINYLAASVNLDGIRAAEVAQALSGDINEELARARKVAGRLRELHATVPGSLEFPSDQHSLQPPDDAADIVHVLQGALDADAAAMDHYRRLIDKTDGLDWATQDLAVSLLLDAEAHRRKFLGYLRAYRRR